MKKLFVFGIDDCVGDFSHLSSYQDILTFFSQTDIVEKEYVHNLAANKTLEQIFFPLIEKSLRPGFVEVLKDVPSEEDKIVFYASENESPWLLGLIGRYLSSKQIKINNAMIILNASQKEALKIPTFWPIEQVEAHVKNFNFLREQYPKHRIIAFDVKEHDFLKTKQKRLGDIYVKVEKAPKSRLLHDDCLEAWVTFQRHVGSAGMRDYNKHFFDVTKSDLLLLTLEQLKQIREQ